MSLIFARRYCHVAFAVTALVSLIALPNAVRAQGLYELPSTNTTLPTGATPLGVAAADFKQSGSPGLVVIDSANNNMKVYVATGPGTFQTAFTYPTCATPTAVVAVDLNRDSYPDIAVACSNAVDVFLNDGNGNFGTSQNGYSVPNGVSIATGDFTGDGQIDLAIASSSGSVTLLVNKNGNFTAQPVTTPATGVLTGIVAADFNRDGHLDLAVSDTGNNQVHVLLGDGTGNFTESGTYAVGTGPSGIVAADFNRDGNIDLATSNAGSNNVTILLGSATAAFTLKSTQAAGSAPLGLSVTDVNSDGKPDIIAYDAANSNSTIQGAVAVLLGNGDGTLQTAQFSNLSDIPGSLAAVADFNLDGKPDLGITQTTTNQVTLLLNNTLPTPYPGGRSFGSPHQLNNGYGNMADGVAVADFNHDGLQDVAVTYLEDNSVRVLLNNGLGASDFNTATEYAVGKQPYAIAAADLNDDGYADLVTVNTTDGTISVLLNNGKGGNGTFAAAQTYSVGRLPFQVAIGDLNGDGIPDLAVTNIGGNSVSILFGGPGGTFTTGPTVPTGVNPYGVAIGDFAHNGHPGLAVTCYHDSQLYVFPNNGNGVFGTPFITSTDTSPTSVIVGDFNRDGNLDVVTGNAIANDVSFFAGNGAGGFAAGVISPALNFPVSIAAGDINGDGILDLVAVAPNYNQVSVTLGKGDGTFGTFQQRAEFAAGTQPWAVALADFNNDGQLDIVTANTFERVNIASPAYQQQYMKEFPPTPNGNPSINVLSNASAASASLTTSPTGQLPAQNSGVTVTAYVQPALTGATPTGSVIFEDINGAALGSGPYALSANGNASYSTGPLGSGQHLFTTLYSGDPSYQPMTGSGNAFSVTVAGTPVTLTLNPTIVSYGGTFTATVTVTGTAANGAPQGTATIYGAPGNIILGPIALTPSGNNATGTGTFTATSAANLNAGNYQMYALFSPLSPTGPYPAGSSSQEALTVAPESTTLSLNCSLSILGCVATVTPANVGLVDTGNSVSFTVNGGSATSEPVIANNATFLYDFGTSYGQHQYTVVATFQPATPPGNYVASQATFIVRVHCTPHGCTPGNALLSQPISLNSLTGVGVNGKLLQESGLNSGLQSPKFVPFNYHY